MVKSAFVSCLILTVAASASAQEMEEDRKLETCSICKLGVRGVGFAIQSQGDKWLGKLSDYCDKVADDDAQKLCKQFADDHGKDLLELVSDTLDARTVCGAIGVCD